MASWGHSCLLLAVEIVDWSLVISSETDTVLLVCDGKEHRLSVDILFVVDEGSRDVCVVCRVPFSATRYVSNLSKHLVEAWYSLEQYIGLKEDKLSSTTVDFIRSEGNLETKRLYWFSKPKMC